MKFFWYTYIMTIVVEIPMSILAVAVLKQNVKMGIFLLCVLYIFVVIIYPLTLYKLGRPLNIDNLEKIVSNTSAGVFLFTLVLLYIFDYLKLK